MFLLVISVRLRPRVRKRMGIEPTPGVFATPDNGFEGRGPHQLAERFREERTSPRRPRHVRPLAASDGPFRLAETRFCGFLHAVRTRRTVHPDSC